MAQSADGPGTPWDIEIESLHRAQGLSIQAASDLIAINWLKDGDTRALAALLLRGHVPSAAALSFLGRMLLGSNNTSKLPPSFEKEIPFQLIAKPRSRRAGRPRDRAKKVRDILIAAQMAGLKKGGLKPGQVKSSLEEALAPAGVDRKTIERAPGRRAKHLGHKPPI
jgi:hypothetical protein